jgi:uncharacterized protein (DUF1800 family)
MKTKFILTIILFTNSVLFAQEITTFGKGNIKGVNVNSSSNSPKSVQTLMSTGYLPNPKASSRFLSQATLGAKYADIQSLQTTGLESWLNTQLNLPYTFNLKNYVTGLHQYKVDSINATPPIPSPLNQLKDVFIDDWAFDVAWFQGSMTSADQLRWRVGMALSEIFVTSRISAFDNNPYALGSYYDVLNKNAFGNYRSLIDSISYHPTMGVYLTYLNNHATDTTGGKKVFPDENYAREIMQLFSIGLYELNIDGTERKDANNRSIPTYTNNDISNLAKVFTGLTWSHSRFLGDDRNVDLWSYTRRMKIMAIDSSDKYNRWWLPPAQWRIVNGHETGTKTFLGQTIPNRTSANGRPINVDLDISDALNILFNHPNVGPFISRRLIQQLVTSSPSPAFISRIATVFNNNGLGVRGDMKAVIRAILLDAEARDCCGDKGIYTYGHLRSPFLRYMNLVKGLNLTSPTNVYRNVMVDLYDRIEQKPLYSPSVFNFYSPNYVPDGPLSLRGKAAPEFQMLNSLSFANYMNGLHKWIINNDVNEYYGLFNTETYKSAQDPSFDLTAEYPLATDLRLMEFLDKYNLILAQGSVTRAHINVIANAVKRMPITYNTTTLVPDPDLSNRRLRMALFLIMVSPDYLINR